MNQIETETLSQAENFDFTSLPIPINPQEAQWIIENCPLIPYLSQSFHEEFQNIKGTPGNLNHICASCWWALFSFSFF